ncbi:MAG TPA: methionyl-tRNA formyltransferase, partial [Thermoanaerobaculia bacterium]
MKIVFWGTPAFSLPALRALGDEGHDVLAVVTQPDRPAGRGRELARSAVKVEAAAEGIPVLQPEKAHAPEFVAELRALAPDLSVVVAYGQILKPEVLSIPRLGSVNIHGSLLPELRGAAPVQWAIIRGMETAGVTIMRMEA